MPTKEYIHTYVFCGIEYPVIFLTGDEGTVAFGMHSINFWSSSTRAERDASREHIWGE